ncbi:hypothetical protein FEF34_24830 [Streptomyces marianii]|uniref:Uncharacterized protein n=1 Tax=Streptomyces marianii TaxID=1817406 RepID=A0A5R9EDU7_9ACTN|nr:hypothetical protein FEF34_24830 [Streptomyces marianii]
MREYNREARRTATQAQVAWNKGLTGEPEARETRPVGRDCVTPGCGQLAELPQPAAHMVRVEEPGSREPARWYCAQGCAGYGQALAEIRAIP